MPAAFPCFPSASLSLLSLSPSMQQRVRMVATTRASEAAGKLAPLLRAAEGARKAGLGGETRDALHVALADMQDVIPALVDLAKARAVNEVRLTCTLVRTVSEFVTHRRDRCRYAYIFWQARLVAVPDHGWVVYFALTHSLTHSSRPISSCLRLREKHRRPQGDVGVPRHVRHL